jgi:hypothetical protein
LILFLLLLAVQTQAATYWVRPTGTMAGCTPSASAPANDSGYKSTIDSGIGCMSGGDTLYIRAGSYAESLGFYGTAIPSGNSSVYTKIAGYNNEAVTITGNAGHDPILLYSPTPAYIEFNGLKLDPNYASGAFLVSQGANHIRLINSEVTRSADAGGVELYEDNNTIGGFNEILNNSIHNNGDDGHFDHGIYVHSRNNLIQGNDIYSNAALGIQFYNAGNSMGTGNKIVGNRIHSNGTLSGQLGGLLVADSPGIQIYNNLIYGNQGEGLLIFEGQSSGFEIYNNTIYGNQTVEGVVNGNGISFSVGTTATVRNNIIFGNAASAIVNNSGGITFSNNYCNSGCTGTGTINNTADPFVNAASGDFTLISTSTAIDAGVDLGFNYNHDYANVARPVGAGWDIGAYEYPGTAPPAGAVLVAQYGFNEAAGNPQDTSGYANHVTAVGTGVTHTTSGCKYGNCMTFTGLGGLTVASSASLSLSQFTMEAWVKPTVAPPSTFVSVVSHGDTGYYWLFASTLSSACAGSEPIGGFAGAENGACDTSTLAQDTWVHIAVSYDGTNVKFYRGGSLVRTTTPGVAMTSGQDVLYIGTSQYSEHFTGLIDDLRIWNGARTAAEIVTDLNTPAGSANIFKVAPATELKIGAATLRKRGN